MRKLLAVTSITLALLAWHANVYAACRTHTIFTGDGRIIMCWTCCNDSGSNCTTTCTP